MKLILFYILLFTLLPPLYAQSQILPFQPQWEFRQSGKTAWYKAEVPGTVHTDLLANKLIAEPFYRDNESKLQWIEKVDWEYRCFFTPDTFLQKQPGLKLVFEGLDTYAKIFLNGELVLEAGNMFRTWKIALGNKLKCGSNELLIIFPSAANHDDSLALRYPVKLPGENNRMYSRKAQYQYGWDWGPRLVTAGIWKPVHWELSAPSSASLKKSEKWNVQLIDTPDASGRAFYFIKMG